MRQILITKAIEKSLQKYPLYSQAEKGREAKAIVKFFLPSGYWAWYVTEAEKQENGDYLFYGLCVNGYGEIEMGYFTLAQLKEIRVFHGLLGIERDFSFKPTTLNEIIAKQPCAVC